MTILECYLFVLLILIIFQSDKLKQPPFQSVHLKGKITLNET